MRATRGDRDEESRASADLAFHAHVTAVQSYQLVHQSESNAAAFEAASFCASDAVKALEHARQFRFGDARAGVAHARFHPIAEQPLAYRNRPLERELERILYQVHDHLFP